MYYKELYDLPHYPNLWEEFEGILDMYNLHEDWNKHRQISINHHIKDSYDVISGVGSLRSDWLNVKMVNGKMIVPRRESKLEDTDFVYINKQFQGSTFEDIIHELANKGYKAGRTRLMKVNPHHCISWHKDRSNRIHYPIKTNDACFMVMGDAVFHLKQERWYYTYTREYFHTALNASEEDRVHLVVSLIE